MKIYYINNYFIIFDINENVPCQRTGLREVVVDALNQLKLSDSEAG